MSAHEACRFDLDSTQRSICQCSTDDNIKYAQCSPWPHSNWKSVNISRAGSTIPGVSIYTRCVELWTAGRHLTFGFTPAEPEEVIDNRGTQSPQRKRSVGAGGVAVYLYSCRIHYTSRGVLNYEHASLRSRKRVAFAENSPTENKPVAKKTVRRKAHILSAVQQAPPRAPPHPDSYSQVIAARTLRATPYHAPAHPPVPSTLHCPTGGTHRCALFQRAHIPRGRPRRRPARHRTR